MLQFGKPHFYADDTQLYLSFNADDDDEGVRKFNHDLVTIQEVSEQHNLSINSSKSCAILYGSPSVCERWGGMIHFFIVGDEIQIFESVRNLGLIMDNSFLYRSYIAVCVRRSLYTLRLISPHRTILICDSLVLSNFIHCSQVFVSCLDQDTLNSIQFRILA